MNQANRTLEQGFTLIEITLVMALIGILAIPLLYLEVYSSESVYRDLLREEMAESGNRSVEWMAKDFRAAAAVMDQWQDQPPASDRLILAGPGRAVIVYAWDRKLRALTRATYPGGPESPAAVMTLARDVSDFEISPVDPKARLITIRIELSRDLLNHRESFTLHGTAGRRLP